MPNQAYNPVKSVGGVTVPVPSKYDWKLSDVSAADAGRTEDALMHKMRIAQKVHIELEWQNITDADAQVILAAFQSEYISIQYYDYKALAFQTKTFYVGDRSVTTYSRLLGRSSLSLNIIEQ